MTEHPSSPSTVTEAILGNLENLTEAYRSVVKEPGKAISEKESHLRSEGEYIYKYSPSEGILKDRSMIAVDGGLATEQLVGGDLVIAGATMANALHSVPVAPGGFAEGRATIVPHTSQTEQRVASALMKGMELRVLQQVEANHTIIDGAYLGNVSEILFSYIQYNPRTSHPILLELNEGDVLNQALISLLSPDRNRPDRYIAIPKSDSSYVQSKMLFGAENPLSAKISDRMIASRMLDGGEFTLPRPIETNNALRGFLNDLSDYSDPVRKVLEGKHNLLLELGGSWDATMENRLYSLYFKPTSWSRINKALKLEFVSFSKTTKGLMDDARNVIQLVNDDVPDSSLMEPFCQYQVDVAAKNVKHAVAYSQQQLVDMAETDEDRYDLLYRYRT